MSYIDTILVQLTAVGFDNSGNDAIFNMIAQGIGESLDNVIQEFQNTENSILSTINNQRYGKAGYYTAVALAFQFGDDLVEDPNTHDDVYAVIDPTKQIVKQASFTANPDGTLSLKIAGQDALSGLLNQLTPPQIAAFSDYFVNFEIPGLPVSIVCLPANIFSFNVACTYSAGYNLTNLQTNVQNALQAFLTAFNFNGVLYVDQLSFYIKQTVPGVIDFFVYNTVIDSTSFFGSTQLTAGYFNYPTNIFNNITFTAVNG